MEPPQPSSTPAVDASQPGSALPAAAPPSAALAGWVAALLALTLLVCFTGLDGGARFEPIDCWVAQTAREMRQRGDWISPYFAGQPRMQKSPGAYWAVMLTSLLRGTPVDTVSARLPSAVAAVLLVGAIFCLTRSISGDRAAVFAGFAALSSTLVLYWSHRAASDLGLTALLTLSLVCVWFADQSAHTVRRRLLLLAAYFLAGLGMLYKMPMPIVCVGLPAVAYAVIRRRWRLLFDPVHLLGLVAFCVPWLPWAIAVYLGEPTALEKWRVEFLDRATGDLPNVEAQKTWPFAFFYLLAPLAYCFPYVVSLPAALARPFLRRDHESRDGRLFALVWFVSLLLFFTAAVGKELRYLLPALPPLFVLLGGELSDLFARARDAGRTARSIAWAATGGVPAGFVAGAVVLHRRLESFGHYSWADVWPPYAVLALIVSAGFAASAWLYARRRGEASFAALVATMLAAWFWTWPNLAPILLSQAAQIDFAAQLRDRLSADHVARMRSVASHTAPVIWYSDLRFPRVVDQLELLRLQAGRRSAERERRLTGERIVELLSRDELVLFVAERPEFVLFMSRAPAELAATDPPRTFPPVHLWLQSRTGPKSRHLVLFGNRPPPWPEPPLTPPSRELPPGSFPGAPAPSSAPAPSTNPAALPERP